MGKNAYQFILKHKIKEIRFPENWNSTDLILQCDDENLQVHA